MFSLPTTVTVSGTVYPVRTDFRLRLRPGAAHPGEAPHPEEAGEAGAGLPPAEPGPGAAARATECRREGPPEGMDVKKQSRFPGSAKSVKQRDKLELVD